MTLVTHKFISSMSSLLTPDYKHSEPVNQNSILPFTKIIFAIHGSARLNTVFLKAKIKLVLHHFKIDLNQIQNSIWLVRTGNITTFSYYFLF